MRGLDFQGEIWSSAIAVATVMSWTSQQQYVRLQRNLQVKRFMIVRVIVFQPRLSGNMSLDPDWILIYGAPLEGDTLAQRAVKKRLTSMTLMKLRYPRLHGFVVLQLSRLILQRS